MTESHIDEFLDSLSLHGSINVTAGRVYALSLSAGVFVQTDVYVFVNHFSKSLLPMNLRAECLQFPLVLW